MFCFGFFLAVLCGMQDPISPTRDQTHAPCIEIAESSNNWVLSDQLVNARV